MIRIKDLLFEEQYLNNPQGAKKLLSLLRSGNWIIPQKKGIHLYRGTDNDVRVGVKEKYDEYRDPMSTSPVTQYTVDTIIEARYPNWPKRGSSRFASTFKGTASGYGELHYVFPRKGSKLASFPRDAYIGYFGSHMRFSSFYEEVNDFQRELNDSQDEYIEVFSFLEEKFEKDLADIVAAYYKVFDQDLSLLNRVSKEFSLKEQSEIVNENRLNIRDILDWQDYPVVSDLREVFYDLKEGVIDPISDYFEDGEEGIHDKSREVMMEGDVLHVNTDFLDRFLVYKEGEAWQMREQFK